MSNKKSVKYQKVTPADIDIDIEEDTETDEYTHPLDSPHPLVRCFQYIFHIWVFRLLRITKQPLQTEDIPKLPKKVRVGYAYQNWMKIYQYRKNKNLPTNTLAMIWHSEKINICLAQILNGIYVFGVYYASFIIVRHHLYHTLIKIILAADSDDQSENMHLLWDLSKYALLLFVVAVIGCICMGLGRILSTTSVHRAVACMQYQLYNKLLLIDVNEPNKQQLLNIVGAELSTLSNYLESLLYNAAMFFFLLIVLEIVLYKEVSAASFFGVLFIIFVGLPFQLFAGLSYAKNQKERLSYSSQRVQLITQLIGGIRFLKCNVSEIALMNKICQFRAKELKYVKNINAAVSTMFLLNVLVPPLTIVVILMVYMHVFGNDVTVLTIVSLTMSAHLVQYLCRVLPAVIGALAVVVSTTNRIDEFLDKKEKIGSVTVNEEPKNRISENNNTLLQINNASFKWNSEESTDNQLKNINLKIEKGKLIAIVGKVGSGKSCLIQSILGEMQCVKGDIDINVSKYGFCSQIPYIQNATFRDNIVMDLPFNEEKYKRCISAAALESDLRQLAFGDLTVIGAEGINISGGQKMRLCFARTLYRKDEYDLFLFDDPLSAVDIYVGKHMFENGILKYLQLQQSNKTCLMTINSHLYLLKYFDEIIIVENGEVKEHTKTSKLFEKPYQSNEMYQKYAYLLPELAENEEEKVDENADDINIEESDMIISRANMQNFDTDYLYFNEQTQLTQPGWDVYRNILKYSFIKVDHEQEYYNNTGKTKKISNENCKIVATILGIFILFVLSCGMLACDVWLIIWRENVDEIPLTKYQWVEIDNDSNLWYFGVWFAILVSIGSVTFLLLYCIGNVILINSADSVFLRTLLNILKCNTLFFDLIPRGQLLNVLSSDTNSVETNFPQYAFMLLMTWSTMVGYFGMIAIITPTVLIFIIFFVLPITYMMARKIQKIYYALSVLWKISLSPILSLFDESITGLNTIRAYKLEGHFSSVIRQRINTASKCKYNSKCIIAWSYLYLNVFLQFCVLVSQIYFGVRLLYFNSEQDSNLLALSMWWYSAVITQILPTVLIQAEMDSHLSSVQKMFFYCNSDTNIDGIYKSRKQKSIKFAQDIHHNTWPLAGDLNIQKLSLRYRTNFDIVLNIETEINIKHGTKLAICGRTGSGKSSILVSIFRLFEPCADSCVLIDKLDIYKLGLFDVRSNVSIIMQTPVMFTGSLRFNLDPFSEYTDTQIWNALKDVQLFELIRNRENCLYCEVGESGSNFSVGEAQLICFARAILKQTKILFMDEPTSSIDKSTDAIMQKLIRSDKFKNTTVICIAHRLQTILDYDRILLLEKGKILEFDSPKNLISDKSSKFYNLLHVSNLYYK